MLGNIEKLKTFSFSHFYANGVLTPQGALPTHTFLWDTVTPGAGPPRSTSPFGRRQAESPGCACAEPLKETRLRPAVKPGGRGAGGGGPKGK